MESASGERGPGPFEIRRRFLFLIGAYPPCAQCPKACGMRRRRAMRLSSCHRHVPEEPNRQWRRISGCLPNPPCETERNVGAAHPVGWPCERLDELTRQRGNMAVRKHRYGRCVPCSHLAASVQAKHPGHAIIGPLQQRDHGVCVCAITEFTDASKGAAPGRRAPLRMQNVDLPAAKA